MHHKNQNANANALQGTVSILAKATGVEYQWRWPNGRLLHFNQSGYLESIKVPTGEFLTAMEFL